MNPHPPPTARPPTPQLRAARRPHPPARPAWAYIQQQRRAGLRDAHAAMQLAQRHGKTGRRPRRHQRRPHRIADEVMHKPRLAEAHLGLRRMHVDIHLLRRHLQKQQHHRERCRRNDVAIGLGQRMQHHAVAHQPLVHEDVHRVAVQLLQLRLGDEPRKPQKSRFRGA